MERLTDELMDKDGPALALPRQAHRKVTMVIGGGPKGRSLSYVVTVTPTNKPSVRDLIDALITEDGKPVAHSS
jgi:hypothetical protein